MWRLHKHQLHVILKIYDIFKECSQILSHIEQIVPLRQLFKLKNWWFFQKMEMKEFFPISTVREPEVYKFIQTAKYLNQCKTIPLPLIGMIYDNYSGITYALSSEYF